MRLSAMNITVRHMGSRPISNKLFTAHRDVRGAPQPPLSLFKQQFFCTVHHERRPRPIHLVIAPGVPPRAGLGSG